MNPPLSQTTALTQLKLLTSQNLGSGNFTFTDDELNQALQAAWNDPFVVKPVWDSSISFVSGTWQYALPATVTTVKDLYYTRTTTDYPERISPDLYEVVNGEIQFQEYTQQWIDDTYTLYIKGSYKLASTDNLTTTAQVNYVMWRSAEILLNNLTFKKAFYFLKTDTTMQDIQRAIQMIQPEVLRWKQGLLREFESA